MAAEKDNTAKTHVLHVDDDPDIRLLISASLRDFGYVVATAGTTAEALELAKQFKFDLCILDVPLPDGSGIKLCQEIINCSRRSPCFIIPPTPATRNKKPRSRFAAMPISKNRSRLLNWKKRSPNC